MYEQWRPVFDRIKSRKKEGIEPDAIEDLKDLTLKRIRSAYASPQPFLSVLKRADAFRSTLQAHDPTIGNDMAYLMWVEWKMQQGHFQASSANQAITFYRMARVGQVSAYTKGLSPLFKEFDRLEAKRAATPPVATILSAARSGQTVDHHALLLQVSIGARFVDLVRLRAKHVRVQGERIVITLAGGKTDRKSLGQTLSFPRSAEVASSLLNRVGSTTPEGYVFPELEYRTYLSFTKTHLGVTPHLVRHATLSHTAEIAGEQAAQALGRHRNVETTRQYTDRTTWGSTVVSAGATEWLSR